MRAVIISASALGAATARELLAADHECVLIDRNEETLNLLEEELDAGFILGDPTKPSVLKEADPAHTDILFCLSESDPLNIMVGLLARSLGFRRVINKIEDPELEKLCAELGLTETIIPTHALAIGLSGLLQGDGKGLPWLQVNKSQGTSG